MTTMNMNYQNDMRQLAGLLFVLGACAMLFPVKDAVVFTNMHGPNNTQPLTDPGQLQLWMYIGDLCVIALGLYSMGLAHLLLVRDYGTPMLTMVGIVLEQTTFIEWITTMVNIGKGGMDTYFKVTGILTVLFLCFLLYGSLGLVLFTIYDYQTKDPPTRNAGAFRKRLIFYSTMYLGVGICRFLMPGVKVLMDQGNGPLTAPFPVVAGPIVFPEMEIVLGCTCSLLGLWGIVRGMGIANSSGIFTSLVGFNYVLYIALKVLIEIGWFAPPPAVASSTTIALVFLPGHIMLAFLDDKARLTPEQIDPDYYQRTQQPGDSPMGKETAMNQSYDPEQPAAVSDDGEEVYIEDGEHEHSG